MSATLARFLTCKNHANVADDFITNIEQQLHNFPNGKLDINYTSLYNNHTETTV